MASGLSPLARGTPESICCSLFIVRFIPAGAGNTSALTLPAAFCAVYPRWRGEHALAIWTIFPVDGLSPLARGTPQNLPAKHS
ncbi:CRISPR-associated helicase Cas3 [Salmonella enterica subsp. enterica serovar Typhimurium]|nr:CRISPR-associated helicase Cas3 [Salmonella enterica subsp. enterica serovar Typhimurium]